MRKRIKNVDCDGKPIKSGSRVTFDGSVLMCQPWIEQGKMDFNRFYNCWFFVPDKGEHHVAVCDWSPDHRRIFKYYRLHPPCQA